MGYGYVKLNQRPEGKDIKIAVVQGNIPQAVKWDAQFREDILEQYLRLTKEVALEGPELIIWPETSVPGFLLAEAELLKEIMALSKKIAPTQLLVGAPHQDSAYRMYNSAILLSSGEIIQRYDKLHLVPFGEFIPLPQLFSRFSFAGLIGGFVPGEEYTVFSLGEENSSVKLSTLICFEDVFGHLARKFVQKGANVLVNITNDAWFGPSAEPYQHLQSSVFRAVENRVNVVRSANTGISCFIDPWGKVLSRVSDASGRDLLVAGTRTQELTIASMSSFYTSFGDIFAWFCCLVGIIAIFRKKFPIHP